MNNDFANKVLPLVDEFILCTLKLDQRKLHEMAENPSLKQEYINLVTKKNEAFNELKRLYKEKLQIV